MKSKHSEWLDKEFSKEEGLSVGLLTPTNESFLEKTYRPPQMPFYEHYW